MAGERTVRVSSVLRALRREWERAREESPQHWIEYERGLRVAAAIVQQVARRSRKGKQK